MTDARRRRELLARLDQIQAPAWQAEIRRYYAEHGSLRPDQVARLRGKHTSGLLSQPGVSPATLLQRMASKPRK